MQKISRHISRVSNFQSFVPNWIIEINLFVSLQCYFKPTRSLSLRLSPIITILLFLILRKIFHHRYFFGGDPFFPGLRFIGFFTFDFFVKLVLNYLSFSFMGLGFSINKPRGVLKIKSIYRTFHMAAVTSLYRLVIALVAFNLSFIVEIFGFVLWLFWIIYIGNLGYFSLLERNKGLLAFSVGIKNQYNINYFSSLI